FCLFTAPSTTVTYTLSLHDALPILESAFRRNGGLFLPEEVIHIRGDGDISVDFTAKGSDIELHLHFSSTWLDLGVERAILMRDRSEEHTSELQSRENLVCRLLLEKK